jgi:acetylornithine deacetylase/succinyl-diaminopimelate desuccinylase-like protein
MDEKLLLEIFRIPAMSYHEEKMADFIKKKLNEYKVPYKQDSMGNIYNISFKDRPLISAHMDTVQDETDTLLTDFIRIKGNYLSGYGVIGGDDKCGIYIILKTLKERNVNFIFFVQEESGGNGSSEWIKDRDLDHVLYGLVLDRMGNGDIICTKNDYGTKEFEIFLHEVGKDFGYSPAMGTFSDADRLNDLISCANLSCGYYGAHSKHEYVNLVDLENAFKYVNAIISHVNEKFEKPVVKNSYYGRGYGAYGSWDYDDDYYYMTGGKKKAETDNQIYGITTVEVECSVCKIQKKTVYINTINDFICFPCIGVLKDELEEAEIKVFSDNDFDDEEWVNGMGG